MKRLAISMSILLIAGFILAPALTGTEDKASELATRLNKIMQAGRPTHKGAANIKPTADASRVAGPNEVKETKELTPMEKALNRVNQQSQREMREWMRGTTEKRINLTKAVQRQAAVEFNFIREIAAKEGAVKTTEAIDLLLASRKERFAKLVKQMEEEAKKMRLSRRETRRDRGETTRGVRSRYRGRNLNEMQRGSNVRRGQRERARSREPLRR